MKGQWDKIENMPRNLTLLVVEVSNDFGRDDIRWLGKLRYAFAYIASDGGLYADGGYPIPLKYVVRAMELPE